ncbi:MAG: AAA family ATPase [Cellulosilyticaceae bacterium]
MADIPQAAPLFVMRPIEEVYDWQTMLFYGDFGSGKTHLAGTAALVPEMCDVLYISLEGGEKTLKEIMRICKKGNIAPDKIMVIPVQSYKQYSFVYEFLKIHVKARDMNDDKTLRRLEAQVRGIPNSNALTDEELAEIIPEPKKFRTVISDSLTEAQKYCMYQILGIDPNTQKIDAEPDSAQFQDWGKSREMIQFLVRRYRDLPIHSIFICGESIEQDAKKQFHYEPMLPGKLSDDVRGLVDTVGYLAAIPQEGGNIVRRIYLVGGMYGGAHLAAKHRYGAKLKGLYLDNPSMKDFYELGLDD